MRLRQGVQSEIVISLALVMATGTALLAAILLEIADSRVEALHGLLGRGFVASTRHGIVDFDEADAGRWWAIDGRGGVRGLNAPGESLDARTRALADEVRRDHRPLVESGAPWEPIRFAAPDPGSAGVLVGRIDPPIPVGVLGLVLLLDIAIFVLFGWSLLRRRIVGPLHRLVSAVRDLGGAESTVAVPVEGVAEIEALARAFNEMQEALATRTGALEKAIRDLRSANASLLQARAGLDRAERLAVVGSLAAGVAHEVGNPMGAMLAYLELVGRDPALGDEAKRCLARASEQGERVRVILRQLLDFSRPPRSERGPLDLADVAQRVIELISTQHASAGVEVELAVAEGVVPARGDLGLALQVVLNLALNAVAAVRGRSRRIVRIDVAPTCRRRRQGELDAGPGNSGRARVDAIVCRVSDSGDGVAAENVARIFDPFFTTKAPGEGTGLGLANARRLAEEMDGEVELEAERSILGGACFRFVLPVFSEAGKSGPTDGIRRADAPQSRMS